MHVLAIAVLVIAATAPSAGQDCERVAARFDRLAARHQTVSHLLKQRTIGGPRRGVDADAARRNRQAGCALVRELTLIRAETARMQTPARTCLTTGRRSRAQARVQAERREAEVAAARLRCGPQPP